MKEFVDNPRKFIQKPP
jgi:hypothetical protein